MANSKTTGVIHHLCRAVLLHDTPGMTDGQLLECFLSQRDDAAFAALVRRHGPMVWGVCHRVLPKYHDAEDAFQATFLVLVRRGGSVQPREMVANWLYGVAYQTALKARAVAARRKERERQVVQMPEPAAPGQEVWHDLQPLLDQELSRLPDKYRVPIVLCDLEGKTRKEAAHQLGWPEGTVAGRLATARKMLARRLAQRGVVLSSAALAAVLGQKAASAGVPTALVYSTIKAAGVFAAGQAAAAGAISAQVAALTEGVLRAMFLSKLKSVMLVLLLLVTLSGVAGVLYRTQAAQQPPSSPATAKPATELLAKENLGIVFPDDLNPRVQQLQKQLARLRADNEELKKRLQQAVRRGKGVDLKLVVKVYPVGPLLLRDLEGVDDGGAEAQPLIRAITRTIEPTSWCDMGGDGSVEYVRPASSIVVRQTPDIHQQVQDLLDALRKNRLEQQKAEQRE